MAIFNKLQLLLATGRLASKKEIRGAAGIYDRAQGLNTGSSGGICWSTTGRLPVRYHFEPKTLEEAKDAISPNAEASGAE